MSVGSIGGRLIVGAMIGHHRAVRARIITITAGNADREVAMSGTTQDTILVILFLAGMAIFGLAMFGLALRVGPKRGTWAQPVAALERPGRRVFIWLYVFAAIQVLGGLCVAIFQPDGLAVLLVTVVTAGFYLLCAHSWALAQRTGLRRGMMRNPAVNAGREPRD